MGGLLLAEGPPPAVEFLLLGEELPPVVGCSRVRFLAVVDIPGVVYIPDAGDILGMVHLRGMVDIPSVVDLSVVVGLSTPAVSLVP